MSKGKKGSMEKNDSPYVVKRPPFAGRYFVWQKDGKTYLFTHRHPHQAAYWSDQIGDWVPTDELKAV